MLGNDAAHEKIEISQKNSQKALLDIFHFAKFITQQQDTINYEKPKNHINLLQFLELNDKHSFTNEQVEFFKKMAS